MFAVRYTGKFGFIKPWTAVRDGETFSQQFLTPSIIEGIEKKLFPELLNQNGKILKIIRHKLSYSAIDSQQEVTQTRGWKKSAKENRFSVAALPRTGILYAAVSGVNQRNVRPNQKRLERYRRASLFAARRVKSQSQRE